MGIVISESGMQFGEYDQAYVYQLEKSSQYTKSLRPNGIKSCEFIFGNQAGACGKRCKKGVADTLPGCIQAGASG